MEAKIANLALIPRYYLPFLMEMAEHTETHAIAVVDAGNYVRYLFKNGSLSLAQTKDVPLWVRPEVRVKIVVPLANIAAYWEATEDVPHLVDLGAIEGARAQSLMVKL